MQDRPDIELVVKDPWDYFVSPEDVVTDLRFSKGERRRILESWALDAELLSQAEAENMAGQPGDPPRLQAVRLALLELERQ